ncbi:MAG: MarR family transcriptional regulator [Alphaproteobacteria bacterium]|nr:MarR family transcriptional regulator [Alphaproteobacteria bacterium]
MQDKSEIALISLRQILRATELSSRNLARESGLTPSQLIILQIVAKLDDAVPSVIARDASLTQATVTSLIDKLERRGMVRRQRDTKDRRRVLIDLTAEGKKAISGAPDLLHDRFKNRFAQLPEWEQSYIIAALERVASILGAEGIDASPVLDVGAIDTPVR